MEANKCCRCLCAFCGKEEGCDNYCEMRQPCSHDAVINCPDFLADHSEFGTSQSRYLACHYSLSAIEDFQARKPVDWDDVKRVLRLVLHDPTD